MKETLFLIDGTALLYRSFFAFIKNPLINSKGQNTSAIFGVINSFMYLVDKMKPEHIVISFDRKAPTFRHEMSDTYKAHRPPMPDDLVSQIAPVKQFFELVTLPEISLDGYEADDILATLAEHFKQDYEVLIVSGDKDFSQLVDEHIHLYDPMKDIIVDSDAVFNKYGVTATQFIDYLALIGDASDNIPGVKGIGPKTAEALLQQYNDLDNIYANLDKHAPKVREKLELNRDNAYLSRDLARIIRDVPIPMPDIERISFNKSMLHNALPLIKEYELPHLYRKIENITPPVATEIPVPKETKIVEQDLFQDDIFGTTPEPEAVPAVFEARLVETSNYRQLLDEISRAEIVSLDTETDSVDPMLANLAGISICTTEAHAWYIPVAHKMADNMPMEQVLNDLKQALHSKKLVGHNFKYDLMVLKRHGLELDNDFFDTMIAAYILDPGTNQYSLDDCAKSELHYTMQPISALIGKGKKQITFDMVDLSDACFYAAEDAWAVFMIYPILLRKLEFSNLKKLYDEIELPLVRVLQKMEETGVLIDEAVLSVISKMINRELKVLTDKIYEIAGYQLNLNSTQQLAKLLFEELKLPVQKKTKTGVSTDSSVLEELAEEYEIAAHISQYRQLTKLEGTYVSALPKMINPHTGRIHSSFNQTIASTGRLSSTNPNLQNIPIRTEIGREIRKAFVAENRDWIIMAADYSQIELRLLALMSRDEVLVTAFRNGVDIHRQMAALISGKDIAEVTTDERRQAKTINFGILYGMGQRKLSKDLGISQAEAKSLITNYFARFPSISDFLQSSVATARKMQYCETLFGRRLYLPFINSSGMRLKSESERVAVNMPIQGTAADIIKIAMIDINNRIRGLDWIRMILQVHDELVFEVQSSHLEEAKELVRTAMENALPEQYRSVVSLQTEIGVGANWYEAH
ncbi:MAG: DNA polymerase I [Candidatus Cloacimonetes bacterium HGW-Cloacimonetes-1]|jgi:DNA polymerase-1|nr:MAG: DNA polymerase I [Candidatus Cloacimonetes bacterium HGW-Cloacimonetes-1]